MARSFCLVLLLGIGATSLRGEEQPRILLPVEPGIKLLPESSTPAWEACAKLDFDGNGVDDAVVEVERGRGPLSTYFGSYRLRAVNGFKLLRNGEPLASGTALTLRDVLEGVDETPLFAMATSLRAELRPQEAASGRWWGKRKAALGIARLDGDDVRLGYVLLSVSDQGVVTVEGRRLERLPPAKVEVGKE